ncbi:MAG TPA: glycosyltransferase family 4 protein [Candidatus Micrarchaeia archaeon]|nr:glycosyltransferase family 4 protein [Candidatus Micrarchaeia archaeon]
MTDTEADARAGAGPDRSPGPVVSWFGHAAGRRADGLSSYSEQLGQGLGRRGWTVFFHHLRGDGHLAPVDDRHRTVWRGARFKTVSVAAPGFRAAAARRLAAERPDIVHCSLSFSLADGWLAAEAHRLGAGAVVTFHVPHGRRGSGRGRVLQALYRFWAGRLRDFDRVIAFTPEQVERLSAAGVPADRCVVIPNAVDTERFRPGASRLRTGELKGARLVVGYLGRLDPEKRAAILVETALGAGLPEDVYLLVAGRGRQEGRVRAAVLRSTHARYLGRLDTVSARADFWRAVDVFCLLSSAEGLSLALLEAMASGCAIVATAEAGAAVAGPGGVTLPAAGVPAALAAELRRLARDPGIAAELGRLARAEAVRHHGVEAMLDRVVDVYRSLARPAARFP